MSGVKTKTKTKNDGRRTKRGYPIPELRKDTREKIADHMFRMCQRIVCDCCDLADIYEADRDNVIEHVVYFLDRAVNRGSFVGFDVKNARKAIGKDIVADVVR